MLLFKRTPRINFLKFHKIALALSILLMSLSFVGILSGKVALGIDFSGGLLLEVDLGKDANAGEVRKILNNAGFKKAKIQKFGEDSHFLIKYPSLEAVGKKDGEKDNISDPSAALRNQILSALKAKWSGASYRRVESVGPKISAELMVQGLIVLAMAISMMLIYIWLRFQWRFSVGAVLALVHDSLIVGGLFIITGIEFNLAGLAAVLTIIGYSINDTVVVYDRLREVMRHRREKSLYESINLALNETLARTVITSFTTCLALGAILILGGPVLRPFSIVLLIGVLVGTYSSLFIATPILLYLHMGKRLGLKRSGTS